MRESLQLPAPSTAAAAAAAAAAIQYGSKLVNERRLDKIGIRTERIFVGFSILSLLGSI